MAKKKAVGSVKNGRESRSKRLGIKKFGGNKVNPGNIIIRQRGTKFLCGKNTSIGRDHTIYSIVKGIVYFSKNKNNKTVNVKLI
ncbi:50S ribosomal protein L27 [Candidatus Vidania fulgoroideorum]